MKPMLNGTGTLWGYRNEATEDKEQFSDCFLFFGAGHQRGECFFSDFVRIRAQLPPPTFQQEAERNPRSKSSGGSLPEKVMIVTNVPVLQCGQRRRSVLFSGLGD